MNPRSLLWVVPVLVQPLLGQGLLERHRDFRVTWESLLEKGDSATVRNITEGLLVKEALAISSSDYNGMRALVGVHDVAARACILEGHWEDGVAHLQKAAEAAATNATNTEETFARIRKEHEAKLPVWRDEVAKADQRLKELDAMPGMTQQQMQTRSQLRSMVDERRSAVSHSERALQEMEAILALLRKEKDAYAAASVSWQSFLEKEKAELTQAGASAAYVTEKFAQVKADDARPRFDRLAYGRRLLKLDPSNGDVKRFVDGLLGFEDRTDVVKPATKKGKKGKSKR